MNKENIIFSKDAVDFSYIPELIGLRYLSPGRIGLAFFNKDNPNNIIN